MKKTLITALLLTLALVTLCSACGGRNETPAPTEAPAAEPSELPTVTKPPVEETDQSDVVSADANDNTPVVNTMDRDTWLGSLSDDQRKVEEELIGCTVEELYAAIGEPISAAYSTSCMVADGEDGLLKYDGFVVSTTRFPSGMELVMGTTN